MLPKLAALRLGTPNLFQDAWCTDVDRPTSSSFLDSILPRINFQPTIHEVPRQLASPRIPG